jgi:hypothetical protein
MICRVEWRGGKFCRAFCTLTAALTVQLAPTAAWAQVSGLGYLVGAPVVINNFSLRDDKIAWHAAGGVDLVRGSKWGFGGEVGMMSFPFVSRTSATGGSSMPAYTSVLVSVNVSHHFVPPRATDRVVHPFVSGGYTFMSGGEGLPMFNIGGGADWWLSRHAGLRVDIREGLLGGSSLLAFRIGVVFK